MDRSVSEKKRKIVSRLTALYLGALLLGEPLIAHNGYFDITGVKTAFFAICTAIYLTGRGVCALQFDPQRRRLTFGDGMALGLCATSLLASIASGFFRASFFGSSGRWQGTLMLWGYAAVCMVMRDVPLRPAQLAPTLCLGLGLSALGCCLDHLGFDLLGFGAALGPFDRGRFISTLGNVNFAGAYLSLTVPAAAWLFLCGEKHAHRLAALIAAVLGIWAGMAVRSDSALLGIGAGLVLLPFALRDRPEALRRAFLVFPTAVLLAEAYRILSAGFGAELSGLTAALLRPVPALSAAIFGVAAHLLCLRSGGTRRSLRAYAAVLVALCAGAVTVLVLLNTIFYYVNLNGWEDWLRFTDAWGTDRLGVWKYCLLIYREFPLWDKLLGGGCGVLARIDAHHPYFPDAVLDAAHCEYLQILLSWGAAGLILYLSWLGAALIGGYRRGADTALMLFPGLAAYCLQAAVNIAQAPGITLFFPLLAALGATLPPKVEAGAQKVP